MVRHDATTRKPVKVNGDVFGRVHNDDVGRCEQHCEDSGTVFEQGGEDEAVEAVCEGQFIWGFERQTTD